MHAEERKTRMLLRRFFGDNKVSSELGQRIWNYIRNAHFQHRTRMSREALPLLDLLPTSLQRCLNEELYSPYITRLPFFFHYASMEQEGATDVCCKAAGESAGVSGDEFFHDGQTASHLHFVITG